VSATIPDVDSGTTAVFTFVARELADTPGNSPLTAIATVTSDTRDPDTSNNTASATASLAPTPVQTDLAIAVSAAPNTVDQGQVLTYTVTVTNNGPIVASNNIMFFNVPSHTTFQSLAIPSGWVADPVPVGATGQITASSANISVGTSAVFTFRVRVDPIAEIGSAITGTAVIRSETLDPSEGNNSAEASATVTHTNTQPPTANVTVAISGDVTSAAVGQDITYTISALDSGTGPAAGTVLHVTLPSTVTLVALGGGTQTGSGVDFAIGALGAGATRQFQMTVRALTPGVIKLITSATASAGVSLGSPASVTTPVASPPVASPPVASPPVGDPIPPTVVRAERFGFHHQPTVLLVSFSNGVKSDEASNPSNYVVLVSAHGAKRAVPISRVYFNPVTHQVTLRTASRIYLYHPWQLVVRSNIIDSSGGSLQGASAATGGVVIKMNRHSLVGRASGAPGASLVGVTAVPTGPHSGRAKKGSIAGKAHPAKHNPAVHTSGTASILKATDNRAVRKALKP
jgi:uncharacterized repeat protein (TIGR01451 family)